MAKCWKLDLPIFNGSGWTTHRFWHDSESIVWEDQEQFSVYKTTFFKIYVFYREEPMVVGNALVLGNVWEWKILDAEATEIASSNLLKPLTSRVGAKNQALRKAAKLVIGTLGNLGFCIE